ncbi:MAG: T9SS type A sorting domain-containing protein [Candidatus Marinimicrobia bacterium]|nr:T9SS type A sorting domain-containing protein [Candidatus Neomarinimicrobiota bacterium]
MKKAILLLIILMKFGVPGATPIEFSSRSIFYGVGLDTFSGFWGISESGNNFSEQDIGTFDSLTQLWILHDGISVYIDENDLIIDFNYFYRYYPMTDPIPAWNELFPEFNGQYSDWQGIWQGSFSLDDVTLFELPLDSGAYILEFAQNTTVVRATGDTVTVEYILPDSLPFKAYFTVTSEDGQSGTEPASPIELSYFHARQKEEGIELSWRSETESENSHFNLYRDSQLIANISGHGNCTDPHVYTYYDADVEVEKVYEYKICDVSWGGIESEQASVHLGINKKIVFSDLILGKVYPNPFNPRVVISMHYAVGSNAVVNIYNTQGILVEQLVNAYLEAGDYDLTWDASGMPSGMYIAVMRAGGFVKSRKIVLMK